MKFLKIDYVCAIWFTGKGKSRRNPVTVQLFLTKVSYLWAGLFFMFSSYINLNVETHVGILMLGVSIIMYGLKGTVTRIISDKDFKKGVKKLSKTTVYIYRVLAILLQFFFFTLMFILGILSFGW